MEIPVEPVSGKVERLQNLLLGTYLSMSAVYYLWRMDVKISYPGIYMHVVDISMVAKKFLVKELYKVAQALTWCVHIWK